MHTSTVFAAIAAIASLVSAGPVSPGAGAIQGDDGIACPKWDIFDTPVKTSKNQCCSSPKETRNQLNCCYTSGKGINSEQLRCSDPDFADNNRWTRNYMCNTKQWPSWACTDFRKMPMIMAQYPDTAMSKPPPKQHQDRKRDSMACPDWTGSSQSLTKSGTNQCCMPGEKNQLNCCYTSGTRMNNEQLTCSSPWFQTFEGWTTLKKCNTRQVPQTACNGVYKMPTIMAKYPEINRHGQYW